MTVQISTIFNKKVHSSTFIETVTSFNSLNDANGHTISGLFRKSLNVKDVGGDAWRL